MSNKIYVFRHTQSTDNEYSIFSGNRNISLSKEGYKKAEILAEQLKDKKIDIAFSSNLLRSIDTMTIVLKYHPKTIICIDDRIRERSYGWFEGQSKKRWAKYAYPLFKIIHRSYYIPPLNGESLYMVHKRVDKFLEELLETIKGKSLNIAICAHSGSIRGIREYFENIPLKDFVEIETNEGELFEYTAD
jgi:broad specificity phosphatase PhoE